MDIYIPSSVLKDRHSTLRSLHQQHYQQQNFFPPIVVVSTAVSGSGSACQTAVCSTSSVCTCIATCPTHSQFSPRSTSNNHPHLVQRSNTNNFHLAQDEERFDRRNSEDEADEREYQEYKRLRKLKKQQKKEVKQQRTLEKREKKEDKKLKKELAKSQKELQKRQNESSGNNNDEGEERRRRGGADCKRNDLSACSTAHTSAVAEHEQIDGEEWSHGGYSTARNDSPALKGHRRGRVARLFMGRRKDGSSQYQELELEAVQAHNRSQQGGAEVQEQSHRQEQEPVQGQEHSQQQRNESWIREPSLSDLGNCLDQNQNLNVLYPRKATSSVSYLGPSSSLHLHPHLQPQNLRQGPHHQAQLSSAVSEPHLGEGGRLGSGRKRTSTGCYLHRVWCKIRQTHKSASRFMMTPVSLQGDESCSRKDL